jgi:hypothetical protein
MICTGIQGTDELNKLILQNHLLKIIKKLSRQSKQESSICEKTF